MNIILKLKEQYIIKKTYSIIAMRFFMLACIMAQMLWSLLPVALKLSAPERISNLIYIFMITAFSFIGSYILDVVLFYATFKKHVNKSIRLAEKQIAPLLCLQLLIPFTFNLAGCFIDIPNFNLIIKVLQWLLAVLYLSYLVFGNVFKEKCITNMVAYLIVDFACETIAFLLTKGISM